MKTCLIYKDNVFLAKVFMTNADELINDWPRDEGYEIVEVEE